MWHHQSELVPPSGYTKGNNMPSLKIYNGSEWQYLTGTGMDNPMTAAGDIIIGGTSGAATRLAAGSEGQVATIVSGVPAWVTPSSSGGDVSITRSSPVSLAQNASTNITCNTVVGVFELLATSVPSYANPGGTGARTGIITVTQSGGWYRNGEYYNLVNGDLGSIGLNTVAAAGQIMQFYFSGLSGPRVVTEIRFRGASGYTYGEWVAQGSNDGSTWSGNLCAATTLGNDTYLDLSANTTGYKYYRLLGVSGTVNGNGYFYEVEFKISSTETITQQYIKLADGTDYKITRPNEAMPETHTIQRLKSGTQLMVVDYL